MLDVIGRLEDLINRLKRKIRSKASLAREIIYEEDLSEGVWGTQPSDFEEEEGEEEGEITLPQEPDSSDQSQENKENIDPVLH